MASADTMERRRTTPVRRTTTPTSTTTRPTTTSYRPDIESVRAYGSVRNAQAGQTAANQARQLLPTQYTDPFAGQNPWDLAQALLTGPTTRSPGGGTGTGGGGGGGGSAADPEALRAAYASLLGEFDPSAFNPAGLLAAYSDDPINQRYDRASREVNATAADATQRMAGIQSDLGARAGVARADVGQTFDKGRAALDALRAQMSAQQAAMTGGTNDVLAKFGAGSVAGPTGDLEQLLTGLQGVQSTAAGAYDRTFADRNEAYAGLGADVNTGLTQQAAGLQSSIAGQRAAGLAANAQQRAQIIAANEQARMAAEQAWRERQAEIRLQAAQLGIDLGV